MSVEITLSLEGSDDLIAGRACIRVPMDQMSKIGLRAGDTAAVTIGRTTHARVVPAPRGGNAAKVSNDILTNAEFAPGKAAKLQPAKLPNLTSVIFCVKGKVPPDTAVMSEALFDVPLTEGDMVDVVDQAGQHTSLEVQSLTPAPAGLFQDHTAISLRTDPDQAISYNGVGGLDAQIARIHEMVAAPLLRPDLFARLGIKPPRGVLFNGPPGSGKTLLARAIAANTSAAFFQLNGPEIVSKHYGESEAALRSIFQAAEKDQPAIIFIDEIDAIAPKRDGMSGEKQVERRMVAQLLTLMDGLDDRGNVVVMAATNLPDSLDSALRRPGRFDREISFPPPDAKQRADILGIHLRNAPLASDVALADLSEQCHGYVGADLAALAREASLAALQRAVHDAGGEDAVVPAELFITQADLETGRSRTIPSVLRETHVRRKSITWADIGGMDHEKNALIEAVIWPLEHAATFEAMQVAPCKGILLSGPPGSGKTLIAQALANESRMNFLFVRPSKIMSQFLGEAERAIADVFNRARQSAPTLIFFDELDGLAPRRGGSDGVVTRIVTQLLAELDGLDSNQGIVVVGATNRAAAIDPALTRPGRFDMVLPIPLPDQQARLAILRVHAGTRPLDQDIDLDALAQQTDGYSGAGLANLVQMAARSSLRRALTAKGNDPVITTDDFATALNADAASRLARQSNHISSEGRSNVPI